jgi:hypothetical protein
MSTEHNRQNILQRCHRLRFSAKAGLTVSLRADVSGERLMLLQLVGSFVLLLDGATPTRTMQLADEASKSLNAETESTVILFGSAKRPPQLSLRSR